MLAQIFTAQEYATENKVSPTTARTRLTKLIQMGLVDSFIRYEDNQLKQSRIDYGNLPPVRVRYYFFKKEESK